MRAVLDESGAENKNLARSITRAQCEKEKTERQLKVRIGDLEELLHHSNIKLKSGAVDGIQTTTIRTLQEELSSARAQLERWRVEAVQVAQEADQKLRLRAPMPRGRAGSRSTPGAYCHAATKIETV